MSQILSKKQIDAWQEQLQQINQMIREENELIPKGQKGRLQKLAREVGASTRGISYDQNGNPYGRDASVSELNDNIHQTLQTLISIRNSEYTRRSVYFAMIAVIVSFIAVIASIYFSITSTSTAQEANRLSAISLQNLYIPWLQITSIKTFWSEPNGIEIVHKCRNFTNAPALNLNIKYSISDVSVIGESPTYGSNLLMPNNEENFNCIFNMSNRNKAMDLLQRLNDGKSFIRFEVNFKDLFGRNYVVYQEYRWIDGTFRMTKYEVGGIGGFIKGVE
jgi:hypothetical protein